MANFWRKQERDFQRQRVYDATEATFAREFGKNFKTKKQAHNFAHKVFDSKVAAKLARAKDNCGLEIISTKDNAGNARALSANAILLPKWGYQDFIILHEVAHCLCGRRMLKFNPQIRESPHGKAFCQIYIGLVEHFIGKRAKNRLIEMFDFFKVKYK